MGVKRRRGTDIPYSPGAVAPACAEKSKAHDGPRRGHGAMPMIRLAESPALST